MRLGIIGCGVLGRFHAPCAVKAGFKVVACSDPVRANAELLAAEHGAEVIDDAMALCASDNIDVVAICTPTHVHAAFVIEAAKHGKHIFCEKPFCRTLAQCDDALAAVKKAGVKLFVGHVVRYFQEFCAMKQQIDEGKIGKPGFVRTFRGGQSPLGEGSWFRDFEKSGGVTLDCIIHDFDWLRYAFGDPERVFSQNLRERIDEGIDYAMVTFRFKSGVIATVTGSWAHPTGFKVKAEICGDNGMITYDSSEAPIASQLRGAGGAAPGVVLPASPVNDSPYYLEWADFQGWLQDKHAPRVTPEDAVWAVRMGLGAIESAETGQPVTF